MQRAATTSFVLTDASSFERLADSQTLISYGGFYQRLASELVSAVHKKNALLDLGERLVVLAEYARASRQMDVLDQVSQILTNSSIPRQYATIGRYYQALCIHRFGRGDVEQAARLLELVAENAPSRYRFRALVSLGANAVHKGDHRSALSFYRNAGRFASGQGLCDPISILGSHKDVAVINSLEGNHRGALVMLESLFSLAHSMRPSHPHAYYDYLNSLAVELCAIGRLEEARNVSEIVLASPIAGAYPEWRETGEEIELRGYRSSRSTVGLTHSSAETVEGIGIVESSEVHRPSSIVAEFAADSVGVSQGSGDAPNILRFPVREQSVGTAFAASSSDTREPARVLILSERSVSERNKTVGKDSNESAQPKKSYEDLDGRERLLKIMELTAAADITDYELLEILESIDGILFRKKDPRKR